MPAAASASPDMRGKTITTFTGPRRPFSRFARAAPARAGHSPAQQKMSQPQALGARLCVRGPSMRNFKVVRSLVFPNVIIAEYLTFMATMASADIHVFLR